MFCRLRSCSVATIGTPPASFEVVEPSQAGQRDGNVDTASRTC